MSSVMTDLKTLIDFLRANGVSHYRHGEMELMLHEVAPVKEEMGFKRTVADEVFDPPKRGADGLTAEEQEALYGIVYDAEQAK